MKARKGSFPFHPLQQSNANEIEGLPLGSKSMKLLKKLNNFRCKKEKKVAGIWKRTKKLLSLPGQSFLSLPFHNCRYNKSSLKFLSQIGKPTFAVASRVRWYSQSRLPAWGGRAAPVPGSLAAGGCCPPGTAGRHSCWWGEAPHLLKE